LQSFAELLADAGWFLYETGLANNALELFRKGEAICHDLFGGKPHALTALFYNNIGVVFDSQNAIEEATEYARNCLIIREACLPPDDPDMGNSYSNLGPNLLDQDRYADAREYYQKAVELRERAATPSDDLLEGAYSCLGFVCIFQDELDEADHWLGLAIIHGNKLKGPNHFTALTLSKIGMLRMKQGRWADARDVLRGCVTSRKNVSGPTHRLVGSGLHQLAFVEYMLGNKDEAIKLLREAVPILRPTIRTHRGLLERSLLKLANCLDEVDGFLGENAEAEELRREVLEVRKGDKEKESLRLDDERGWNDLVPISYRCLW
jgi:tetratricopeptide (TPR) repeat protein